MATDDYQCTLDEEDIQRAKAELNEDPKERAGAVDALRTWVEQQPHLRCITDTGLLLRFLRPAKFSQLRARESLENYITSIMDAPELMQNVDPTEKGVQAALRTQFMIPIPGYDKLGRKIIIFNEGKLDTSGKTCSSEDAMRAAMLCMIYLMFDEKAQVNGFQCMLDYSEYTLKHLTWQDSETQKKIFNIFMKSFTARYKGLHVYNAGAVVDTALALCKPLMSKKLQDRIVMHGSNLESIYKVFPKEKLPREYLPDDYEGQCVGSSQELVESFIKEITREDVRQRLLRETGPEMSIDMTKKDKSIPQASFRKLNVD